MVFDASDAVCFDYLDVGEKRRGEGGPSLCIYYECDADMMMMTTMVVGHG